MTQSYRERKSRMYPANRLVNSMPVDYTSENKNDRLNELNAEYHYQETDLKHLQRAIKKAHFRFLELESRFLELESAISNGEASLEQDASQG